MRMLYFATLFDKNYLSRGLALLESLQKCSTLPFHLYVLALDETVVQHFSANGYPQVQTISLTELETHYPELATAKSNRGKIEYYFTLSPYLPSYILEKYNIDRITTLDSDLYFFSDPRVIFDAYPTASVLITPHNFSQQLQKSEIYGRYNVSFQSFKNDEDGNNCLAQWRRLCHEWCYDELDTVNHRYADQKYLDRWENDYAGSIQAIQIPGTGLAPWNLDKYPYQMDKGRILVNGHPLVYFHFHHVRTFNSFFAINAFEEYMVNTRHKAIRKIYQFYLQRLKAISARLLHEESSKIRYSSPDQRTLLKKLISTNGYWFYSGWFIFYLNPSKNIAKAKYQFKKIYGSITKSDNLHR